MTGANLYYIDGNDIYTTYGIIVSKGSDSFLIPRKRKTPAIVHDWPEEDLIEYDLSAPHFEPRDFKLSCALVAASETDFKTKFNAFNVLMGLPGSRAISVVELNQSFGFFFSEYTQLTRLTRILNATKVAIKFDITLKEVPLNTNNSFPYKFPFKL